MAIGESDSAELNPWSPGLTLKEVALEEAAYSLGFARARVERWFPGLSGHWISLLQGFDSAIRGVEVSTSLEIPDDLSKRFVFSVDGELAFIGVSDRAARVLTEGMLPNANKSSHDVLLEYLARRFVGAMALTWSGAKENKFAFESEGSLEHRWLGSVKISLTVFGAPIVIWIGLSRSIVDKFDGMWRREIGANREDSRDGELVVELGYVVFPPTQIGEYLKPGTAIDLEQSVGDSVIVRSSGEPICEGYLRTLGDRFAFECGVAYSPPTRIPDGMTRLGVAIAKVSSSKYLSGELSQVGAIVETEDRISSDVDLMIDGEKVGRAIVCQLDGRFVVVVQ